MSLSDFNDAFCVSNLFFTYVPGQQTMELLVFDLTHINYRWRNIQQRIHSATVLLHTDKHRQTSQPNTQSR